jgi:thymidylate synthase ThyX
MFKLVKWAFKLGQQTERHRIANILESRRYVLPYGEFGVGNGDERKKVQSAVKREINRIVDEIIEPHYEQTKQGYSLLYPEERE